MTMTPGFSACLAYQNSFIVVKYKVSAKNEITETFEGYVRIRVSSQSFLCV